MSSGEGGAAKNLKMPSSVKVGAVVYQIKHAPLDPQYSGESDHETLVITISDAVKALDAQRIVMVHELLHCAFLAVPRSVDWADQTARSGSPEELIVECLESPVLQIIRDNPKMMRWLT